MRCKIKHLKINVFTKSNLNYYKIEKLKSINYYFQNILANQFSNKYLPGSPESPGLPKGPWRPIQIEHSVNVEHIVYLKIGN